MRRIGLLYGLYLIPFLWLAGTACNRTGSGTVWIERWSEAAPMTTNRAGLGAVSVGRRIYAIGGGEYLGNGLRILDTVEYADVLDDGTTGPWQPASPLNVTRIYLSTAVYKDTIYVMGGEGVTHFYSAPPYDTPPVLLDSVERARILPDGSLGPWILEPEKMQYARRGGELFVHDGWLYSIGGFNGAFLKTVEKSKIQEDGSLGKWIPEKNFTGAVRYIAGYAQDQNRLYLVGGHLHSAEMAVDTVEMAEVGSDSSVGQWAEAGTMTTRRFLNNSVLMDRTLYVLAGQNTIPLTGTERAEILPDGRLSPWTPDTPLNTPRRAAGAVRVGDAIYVLGGMNGPIGKASPVNSVEFAYRVPGKPLGRWAESGGPDHKAFMKWKETRLSDAQAHVQQALDTIATDRHEAILFDTAEALRTEPDNFQALNLRADVLYRMGDVDSAVEALRKSLSIEENNFNALVEMGAIHLHQGNFSEAVRYLETAARTTPDSAYAREQLGRARLGAGDFDRAAADFRWVLEKSPDSPEVRQLLQWADEKKIPMQ